ncbi:winged helix-turn-helix domain-containing protein [Kosakonia sp. H02]|nr:winged helix-turn-helix domain-containing protein [Kosakonia sp. H02]
MKKLSSASNPEVTVTLTTPACRCLLLLLEASPNIVLQQDFFKKVWEEEGMLVPANTLYQNISIVRRGLRAVGDTDQKLIATVPRKGFQIDGGVKIVKQEDIVDAVSISVHIANEGIGDMLAGEESLPEESRENDQIPTTEPKITTEPYKGNFHRWQFSALVILIAFVTGFFLTHTIWHLNDEPAFFDTYTMIETDNGCHFYTTDDNHDNKNPYQRFKSLVLNSGLNCKNYPWVYFPSSLTSPTLTALVCKRQYTTDMSPGCISLHINGVNSDE